MSSASDNSESRTDTNDRRRRQPAKRVFAREFQDATHIFAESDDERAPKFALLPTGERANRLAVVGTLTEAENIGSDTDYWQARVVDPTGTHFAYAGRYQPDAMDQLAAIDPPAYVAVIGKPRTYDEDDETYTSLTIENLSVVNRATRNQWVVEAAEHTRERLDAYTSDDPPVDAVQASEQYGDDLAAYEDCVDQAVADLIGEDSEADETA
jgi:RPA family protein